MPATPFTRFLKALSALNSRQIGDLADRTGLRTSRVREVFAGRTVPRPEEALALLTAAGLPDRALTASGGGAGGREELWNQITSNNPGEFKRSLLGRYLVELFVLGSTQEDLPADGPESYKLRVDGISFTANWTDKDGFIEKLNKFGKEFKPKKRSGYDKWTPYENTFKLGKATVQHTPTKEKNRDCRFDFKPTKQNLASVREFLPLLALSTSRITRVDVCVDLPCSIHDVQLLPNTKRKFHCEWYWGGEGIETSSVQGSNKIRVYDKARESGESTPRTRFELEMRDTKLALRELGEIKNRFSLLDIFALRDDSLGYVERLLVKEARFFGLPALRQAVDAATFKRVVTALAETEESKLLPHPKDVFDEHWDSVARRLLKRLGLKALK